MKKNTEDKKGYILGFKFLFNLDKLPDGTIEAIDNYIEKKGDYYESDMSDFIGMNFKFPIHFTITGILDCLDALKVAYLEQDKTLID